MGGSKLYLSNGGFSKQTYKRAGETPNGIKIIEKIEGKSASLPLHSNTPYTMYALKDSTTGQLKQITVYSSGKDSRTKTKDIDWSHEHEGFKKGEIHVHIYENGKKTKEKIICCPKNGLALKNTLYIKNAYLISLKKRIKETGIHIISHVTHGKNYLRLQKCETENC